MGDLIGALAGYIGGKDVRVTGQIAALPVYRGKLDKPPAEKPKGELTAKQKQLNAYLAKYTGGPGPEGEEGCEDKNRKKKKRKVRRGEEPGRGLRIIDEDKGLGGLDLARAKGALGIEDEELSDEQAVEVEEEELAALKEAQERERKFSSVQVGDGGSGGSNWVTVDENGNIVDNNSKKGKSGGAADRDLSPPRRGADQSPPRRPPFGGGGGGDQSPRRRIEGGVKQRHDSDSDQSPPRGRTGGGGHQSLHRRIEGEGAKKRHDSDSDQSPPRGRTGGGALAAAARRRHDSDSDDLSPPRKKAAGSSPAVGCGKFATGNADLSPPRKGGGRRRHDSDDSEKDEAPQKGINERTVNGLRAGYVSGKELTDTMVKKKEAEDARFKNLDDSTTGRVAETVYRGKDGKKVDPIARKAADDQDEEAMKNMVWGKGLVQMEEKVALAKRIEAEKSKPFARTIDDREMNDDLRSKERWGDPMAGKLNKTQSNRPKYKGPYPPNRYGIAPGYRLKFCRFGL